MPNDNSSPITVSNVPVCHECSDMLASVVRKSDTNRSISCRFDVIDRMI
jgi:hypothetical protein